MKRKLLLTLIIGVVAICAAALGVGCSNPNSADDTPKHNYGEWVIDRAATCTRIGQKYHICQDEGCNNMEWEAIPMLPHDYKIVESITADEHTLKCSVCGNTKTEAHEFDEENLCLYCEYDNNPLTLIYSLNEDQKSYTVTGTSGNNNSLSQIDLIIPSTYNDLPVTAIGSSAFCYCTSLKSVIVPDSVTKIDANAFALCTSLTVMDIPDSVTSIGDSAFWGCDSLTSITIPDSVTSIGDSAFWGCDSLTSITIPDNCTVSVTAFNFCPNLTEIKINDSNEYYKTIDGNLYSKDGTTLVRYIGKQPEFEIPQTVTAIGSYAFSGCTTIEEITIPKGVTSIGDYAFHVCRGLTSVAIPDSVTSIGDAAFYCCSGLTSIIIPNSVMFIGQSAFSGCSEITIYCEAEEQPSGWESEWNYSNCSVVWGYKGEN